MGIRSFAAPRTGGGFVNVISSWNPHQKKHQLRISHLESQHILFEETTTPIEQIQILERMQLPIPQDWAIHLVEDITHDHTHQYGTLGLAPRFEVQHNSNITSVRYNIYSTTTLPVRTHVIFIDDDFNHGASAINAIKSLITNFPLFLPDHPWLKHPTDWVVCSANSYNLPMEEVEYALYDHGRWLHISRSRLTSILHDITIPEYRGL